MKVFGRISVKLMADEFSNTIRRFPIPCAFSLLTTVLLIIRIENLSIFESSPVLSKSIFISILGFFFSLLSALYTEKKQDRRKYRLVTDLIALCLLGILFMTLPSNFRETEYMIFANYLAASLFGLMAVYTENGNPVYFGRYNTLILMRAFVSFIFSIILFSGLASAIFAVSELLAGGDIHEELYGDIWVVTAAFFAPAYFLSGLPDDSIKSDTGFSYPAALKVLLQYILIPLVTLYLIILYAYIAKIILTQKWPEGTVSYLIISFSLTGIITIILLSPFDEDPDFRWMKTFTKYFFRTLIPLVTVLFMAVSQRIGQYGITEKRYFIFLLALWLAGTALYMIFSKKKDLRKLPLSLCLISVLSLYGPWSCFSVSYRSQERILEQLLLKNGLLSEGKVIKASKPVPFDDRKSISSIVSYFYDSHGIEKTGYLKELYQKLSAEKKDGNDEYKHYRDQDIAVSRTRFLKEGLGFDLVENWQTESKLNYMNFNIKYLYDPFIEDISGYDRMIDCTQSDLKKTVFDEKNGLYLRFKENRMTFGKDSLAGDFSIDLEPYTLGIMQNIVNPTQGNQLEPYEMTVTGGNEHLRYKIFFRNFTLDRKSENDKYSLRSVYFTLFYTIK